MPYIDIDTQIINNLAAGLNQVEISKKTGKSLSAIEKRINKIKKEHKAKTLFHLAVILNEKKIL